VKISPKLKEFSGTLSYLFNNFSAMDVPFSEILQEAIDSGFTEPDPREDLGGNDVGRKLLILARELDLQNEFEEIDIQNLIPEHLREGSGRFLD
jgi:aspartokinase/homoserine dehydrogenase 1